MADVLHDTIRGVFIGGLLGGAASFAYTSFASHPASPPGLLASCKYIPQDASLCSSLDEIANIFEKVDRRVTTLLIEECENLLELYALVQQPSHTRADALCEALQHRRSILSKLVYLENRCKSTAPLAAQGISEDLIHVRDTIKNYTHNVELENSLNLGRK